MNGLKKVTKKEWGEIPEVYRGKFVDHHGTHPEINGKKTIMIKDENGMHTLIIESLHFEIVD